MSQFNISGPYAFHKQPSYEALTKAAFAKKEALTPCYKIELENRIVRMAKQILSHIIFPIAIGQYIHRMIGKYTGILPASNPDMLLRNCGISLDDARPGIISDDNWKVKRIAIEVDGCIVDACILGRKENLDNGIWTIYAPGNSSAYELKLNKGTCNRPQYDARRLLDATNSNLLCFNYPGVGSSTGGPSKSTMVKAHKACLRFLEDKKDGLAAKKIITIGESVGGGVQGETLNDYEMNKDVKYVWVKKQTFSTMANTAFGIVGGGLIGNIASLLVRLAGWNLSSINSSKNRNINEIILQTAIGHEYRLLDTDQKDEIRSDGVISKEGSHGYHLLSHPETLRENQKILGIPESHNDGLLDVEPLAKLINEAIADD